MVADSLATILSANEDMTVLAIAGTCASGLEAVTRYRPDVLLLDQRLPDGLGTDNLAAMLEVCPRMKVLLVTAGDTDDVLALAVLAGAAGVIPKGKRAATLVNAVRAVAHNEAVITPDALRRLIMRVLGIGPGPHRGQPEMPRLSFDRAIVLLSSWVPYSSAPAFSISPRTWSSRIPENTRMCMPGRSALAALATSGPPPGIPMSRMRTSGRVSRPASSGAGPGLSVTPKSGPGRGSFPARPASGTRRRCQRPLHRAHLRRPAGATAMRRPRRRR